MSWNQYFYSGDDAAQIRTKTITVLVDAMTTYLMNAGETFTGLAAFQLCRSYTFAQQLKQDKKPFLYMALRPTKTEGCRIQGTDGLCHSGRCHYWDFLFQVSRGNAGGTISDEQMVRSDDALMDEVKFAIENNYVAWRDTYFFYDMRVTFFDEAKPGSALNPLLVRFYNKIQLPTDSFI